MKTTMMRRKITKTVLGVAMTLVLISSLFSGISIEVYANDRDDVSVVEEEAATVDEDDDSIIKNDNEEIPLDTEIEPEIIQPQEITANSIQSQEIPYMSDISEFAEGGYGPNGKFLAPIIPISTLPDFSQYTPISNRAGLEAISNNLNGKYYLTNDINLSGTDWVPIGGTKSYPEFTGVFDGQGYVIRNMKITNASSAGNYNGLFYDSYGANIKNLGIEGTDINISVLGTNYTGGICGDNSGTISNCYNEGSITASHSGSSLFSYTLYAGGISGGNSGNIINCYNTGDVTSSSSPSYPIIYIGGVNGRNQGTVTGSYNIGSVTASASNSGSNLYAGGVCSFNDNRINDVSVNNCYNAGLVSATGANSSVGGVCAYTTSYTNKSVITSCYNVGSVTATSSGSSYVGGIVGDLSNGSVTNSASLGISVNATGNPRSANRVIGTSGTSSTLSNNTAFEGMTVNGSPVTGAGSASGATGATRSKAQLQLATGFPSQLTSGLWTYEEGLLPGLGGSPILIPEHLRVMPSISGPEEMTLLVGYTATSTSVYTITGGPVPTVNKTSGDAKITWNNTTKKLDVDAGLSAGNYPVVLTASNGISPDATFTFTLTVVSPVMPSISGPEEMMLLVGYAATSTAAYTITGVPTPTVSKTSGDTKITWNNTTKKLDINTGLSAGTYPVVLTVSNGVSPDATLAFTLTVQSAPGISGAEEMALLVGYEATSTEEYTIVGVPTPTINKTSGDTKITWNNTTKKLDIAEGLSAGTYPVVLTAGNGVSPDVTLTFTLIVSAPAAPSISGPEEMTIAEGYTAISTGEYTMSGVPTPTVSITSGDGKITWNSSTKKIDIAAGLSVGEYPVVLTTNNGISPNATLTFTLTVATPVAPGISGPEDMTLSAGYEATSTGEYTVTGLPTPTVNKTNGDTKITWNNITKKIDIAEGLSAGEYPVMLTAGNGISPDATLSFKLFIKGAPGISGPEEMALVAGYNPASTGEYTITGFPMPTVNITSGNDKITWNNATNKLDIAVGLTVGEYPVLFTASNGIGPDATFSFNLTIKSGYGSNDKFLMPIEPPEDGSIAISNRAELEAIRTNLSGKFHLVQNIDLSGTEWIPIGVSYFTGVFDGQGFVISNMTITDDHQFNGLFGYVTEGATIKNIGMEGSRINIEGSGDSIYAGGICGSLSSSTINNCYNEGQVSVKILKEYGSTNAYASGISGSAILSSINNCYNIGKVSASSESYDSYACAGGISGQNYMYLSSDSIIISNCYNSGEISASSTSVSYNYPAPYSAASAGGISGSNNLNFSSGSITISNCHNTGKVSAFTTSKTSYESSDSSVYAGGISGQGYNDNYSSAIISDCYNSGEVSASSTAYSSSVYVGGICGYHTTGLVSTASINNCHNSGKVSASSTLESSSSYAGGISGLTATSAINNCYNTGEVSALSASASYSRTAYAGGISGYTSYSSGYSTIRNCYNTGKVSASRISSSGPQYACAGGISGYTYTVHIVIYSAIDNCYNTGEVFASNTSSYAFSGGISGYNGNQISNCYNIGTVSANGPSTQVGGICGFNSGWTDNCYCLKLYGSKWGKQLTAAQMKVASNYKGFNFANVWGINPTINNGYPYLLGMTVEWLDFAPIINTQPVSQLLTTGSKATFSVSATSPDGGTLSYQWQKSVNGGTSWANISGATKASYTTAALKIADNGNQYRCVVTNKKGVETSNANSSVAILTVYNPATVAPRIIAQPENQTADDGGTATFEIEAEGTAEEDTLTYQWQKLVGASWVDIDGEETDTYKTDTLTSSDNGNRFRCVVRNTTEQNFVGQTISRVAIVTVISNAAVPRILMDPSDRTAAVGGTATFFISAMPTDGGILSYQWQISTDDGASWNDITDETGTVFTTPALELTDHGNQYLCVVTNTKGEKTASITSGAAILTVKTPFTEIMLDKTNVRLQMGKDETVTLTAITIPVIAAADDKLVWTSNNDAVAIVDEDGEVTAVSKGSATIAAKSEFSGAVYAYCWVTVLAEDVAKIIDIQAAGATIVDGKITDDLYVSGSDPLAKKSITLSSSEGEAVTWKSSDTKVATVSAAGLVKYIASGMATITATVKAGVNKSKTESVILTIKDMSPKLPVGTIALNTKSDGTQFQIIPTDTFAIVKGGVGEYDDVIAVTPGFELSHVTGTTYNLKVDTAYVPAVTKGKKTVRLQAMREGSEAGLPFSLTVNVATAVPAAKVKMPALNTFWLDASGKISITGTGLPKVRKVELVDSTKLVDKSVTANFTVSPDGIITAENTFTNFIDAKKTKPAVKGTLKIYYEGYSDDDFCKVNVTVQNKPKAPKLTVKPASKTIHPLWGKEASFDITGGKIADVKHTTASHPFTGDPARNGNTITLAVGNHDPKKAQSFQAKLNVSLEGAKAPILVKPTIKTVKESAAATYKLTPATITLNSTLENQSQTVQVVSNHFNTHVVVSSVNLKSGSNADGGITVTPNGSGVIVSVDKGTSARTCKFNVTPNGAKPLVLTVKVNATPAGGKGSTLSAAVKADKGSSINLMNRDNTRFVYTPVIKGTTSAILDVEEAATTLNGYGMFDVKWNPATNKVEVRAKAGETYQRNLIYKLKFDFKLAGGNTLTTGIINIKPVHSSVKHSIPKVTLMHQSRTGEGYMQVINLAPSSPAGAKVETIYFDPSKPKNNPGGAYWYYFDESAQQLNIWIRDGAMVKPGKVTLIFSVTYEGQGTEGAAKTIKPLNLKIPVTVAR